MFNDFIHKSVALPLLKTCPLICAEIPQTTEMMQNFDFCSQNLVSSQLVSVYCEVVLCRVHQFSVQTEFLQQILKLERHLWYVEHKMSKKYLT